MEYKKDWLMIANGEPLPQEKISHLAENKSIMALDGAYAQALAYDLKPDIVLGDLDSIDKETQKEIRQEKSITLVREPDQNTTDLEKGLNYLDKFTVDTVTIINATGWRLDHTLYNLRLLKRFHQKFKTLTLWTALEKIYYLQDQTLTVEGFPQQPLALLAFTKAVVSSSGLQYEMQDLHLNFGYQESISNTLVGNSAQLIVKGGVLLLISHCVLS